MADKGYKEGAMLGAIQIRRPGWGEWRRVPNVGEVLREFGQYAKPFKGDVVPYVKYLINMKEEQARKRDKVNPRKQREIDDLKALVAEFKQPFPDEELKSLTPYLEAGDIELAKELLEYYPTKLKPWNR